MGDDEVISSSLLLIPAIVYTGIIATLFGIVGIFTANWFIASSVIILLIFSRDILSSAQHFLTNFKSLLLSVSFVQIVNIAIIIFVGSALFYNSFIPSEMADVWVYHIPIAENTIKHEQFQYPLMEHNFYGNIPAFVNVLFSVAMIKTPNFAYASFVNGAIFLFFVMSFQGLFRRYNDYLLFIAIMIIGFSNFFLGFATEPHTDLARSIFSCLAVVYLIFYQRTSKQFYLYLFAITMGAAIATKYTEITSFVALIPFATFLIIKNKHYKFFSYSALIMILIAGFWYLKNLFLYGNPVYPFIFSHHGLSDTWMAEYIAELSRPFDPVNRNFNRDLLTLGGWSDFFSVIWKFYFQGHVTQQFILAASLLYLLLKRNIALLMLGISLLFFIIYYTTPLFNHQRFAITTLLIFNSLGVIIIFDILRPLLSYLDNIISFKLPIKIHNLLAKAIIIVKFSSIILFGIIIFVRPPSLGGVFTKSAKIIESGGVDIYLSKNIYWYKSYNYVVSNDLKNIFHPFDTGVKYLSKIYSSTDTSDTFISLMDVSIENSDYKKFISDKNIMYFYFNPNFKFTDIEVERSGPQKVNDAYKVINILLKHSHPIYTDENSWTVYKVEHFE